MALHLPSRARRRPVAGALLALALIAGGASAPAQAAPASTGHGSSSNSSSTSGSLTHLPAVTPSVSNEKKMALPKHYTLKADGSTGTTADAEDIVNMDVAKATVRTYYNATGGVADKTSSPYITEVTGILERQTKRLAKDYRKAARRGEKPAIVVDMDDTTLWTYDMEDASMHFNFTSSAQQAYLEANDLPAVPGMVDYLTAAASTGYTIIGLTGRGEAQRDLTVRNLAADGYPAIASELLFLKPAAADTPDYLDCSTDGVAACNTVEYKAGTRAHIENDLGYTIVDNIGDQWSDLQGGHAQRSVKLPNPTYYLPSADLPGYEKADRKMRPTERFALAADGSTGLTASGEDIPNIDVVKSTIRTYYGAGSDGIADKTASAYIDEASSVAASAGDGIEAQCAARAAAGQKPALTLDADDTTLWTYDMEDGAMRFNFTVAGQYDYILNNTMPAVPGMVDLVTRAKAAGCEIIGLTGRSEDLEAATLANLDAEYGAGVFNHDLYFTKLTGKGDSVQPDYITCAAATCTTVEYKAGTRAHIQDDLGYTIVANIGDQWSDLKGGNALYQVKLPNPSYYLP